MQNYPLLAGWVQADWLSSIAPLFFVVIWVIKQVLTARAAEGDGKPAEGATLEEKLAEAMRRAEGEDAGGRARPQAERAAAGVDDPAGRQQRAEVENFLRRVGESREEKQAANRRRGPIDPFEEPAPRVAEARAAAPPPEIELLVDAEPIEAERKTPAADRTAGLPEKHLAESRLAEQAAHLGERIAKSDEQFEARLQSKFDHHLGRLEEASRKSAPSAATTRGDAGPPKPEKETSSAARIAAMLARPGGVREAIVVSEILRRPTDVFDQR